MRKHQTCTMDHNIYYFLEFPSFLSFKSHKLTKKANKIYFFVLFSSPTMPFIKCPNPATRVVPKLLLFPPLKGYGLSPNNFGPYVELPSFRKNRILNKRIKELLFFSLEQKIAEKESREKIVLGCLISNDTSYNWVVDCKGSLLMGQPNI